MTEEDGKSKCFGFVNFENPDDVAQAVQELNGQKFDDKEWETFDKYQGFNLYSKNLDDSIGDDKLRQLFFGFGTITSCKLAEMNGKMIGGKPLYVALAQSKEERKARFQVFNLNLFLLSIHQSFLSFIRLYKIFGIYGSAVTSDFNYLGYIFQAQFSQVHPAIMANVGPHVPIYSSAPVMRQQIFHRQSPSAPVPPQSAKVIRKLSEILGENLYLLCLPT
ncbi:hypothetical protein ZIOFF_004377 [Zingiber officinale]|uniref:RRM domain-containing protein n=1 Tax=Zingiber officinale TaxID=94328 RepID=A0A8J5MAU3_ZINOF|nr:hypothetical protein ZIOFF_004376 [Zingiber officinale]KAG6539222.1 hypothetical protein ZIOFF_004377 [Zingiber officinale]